MGTPPESYYSQGREGACVGNIKIDLKKNMSVGVERNLVMISSSNVLLF
jgi:hypothetical protein